MGFLMLYLFLSLFLCPDAKPWGFPMGPGALPSIPGHPGGAAEDAGPADAAAAALGAEARLPGVGARGGWAVPGGVGAVEGSDCSPIP